MFRVFQEEKLIAVCMFACLGISVFLRLLLGLLYRNMIKEADNMATTKNKLLRQCKTKFASCYQLSNGVSNIPVFVDKFLNRMALGHLSFETLYHLSGQMMLLSVVFSGVGVCKSIAGGRTLGEVLPFYIVSFFGLYIYFSVSTLVDIRGKIISPPALRLPGRIWRCCMGRPHMKKAGSSMGVSRVQGEEDEGVQEESNTDRKQGALWN